MFSPYYAWSGFRDPLNHCAVNVALYGPRGAAWAMTERSARTLSRGPSHFGLNASTLEWSGDGLSIAFDEWTAPWPRRIRGRVRLIPRAVYTQRYPLDGSARHVWRPIAPRAEVEAVFDAPGLSWRGTGYFDCNSGAEPLERAYRGWTWQRAHRARDCVVHYDVYPRDETARALALRFCADGTAVEADAPEMRRLPGTLWGMARSARSDAAPTLLRTWEDAPFYARSQIDGEIGGEKCAIVHETLSLARLSSPIVRAMLPFRMPRFG